MEKDDFEFLTKKHVVIIFFLFTTLDSHLVNKSQDWGIEAGAEQV